MNIRIQESIRESIDVKQKILSDEALMARVQAAADAMVQSLKAGGKVHFCGNGGSAADAQHLAAELSGRFYFDRPPLNAEALHCNTSYLTAVGNDYGYDLVFSRLLRGTAKKGDVIVGISTSGNSKNILEAFKAAKEMGLQTCPLPTPRASRSPILCWDTSSANWWNPRCSAVSLWLLAIRFAKVLRLTS